MGVPRWFDATVGEVWRFAHAALLDAASAGAPDTHPVRRRVVVAISYVLGSALLGWSVALTPGDPAFYPATLALALVWIVGALASGPLPYGRSRTRAGGTSSGVLQSLIVGAALLVVFLAGAFLIAGIPLLRDPVLRLLQHADGALPVVFAITALNGVAEELFFRGALSSALPRRWRLAGSTVLYTLTTALSGIALLALAAAMLGLVAGLRRRSTGGYTAPIVTHLTWSLGMLLLLPPTLAFATHVFS